LNGANLDVSSTHGTQSVPDAAQQLFSNPLAAQAHCSDLHMQHNGELAQQPDHSASFTSHHADGSMQSPNSMQPPDQSPGLNELWRTLDNSAVSDFSNHLPLSMSSSPSPEMFDHQENPSQVNLDDSSSQAEPSQVNLDDSSSQAEPSQVNLEGSSSQIVTFPHYEKAVPRPRRETKVDVKEMLRKSIAKLTEDGLEGLSVEDIARLGAMQRELLGQETKVCKLF